MEKNNMSYTNFRDKVFKKLKVYREDVLHIEEKGFFRYRGKDIFKDHILPINHKESNVLECLKAKDFLIKEKDLHRYAHHLNSSQLMCYNFFRPYIEVEGGKLRPNKALIKILGKYITSIKQSNDALCQFEYVQQDGEYKEEGTNFDFYLKSGKTEIFFEIKYTEAGYGKCDNDQKHKEKFDTIYNKLIENCPAIKKPVTYDKEFCKNYQLFRNSIRAKDNNKYVVFIYDENNRYCKKQLKEFLYNYIADEYKTNIIGITWQDIVEKLDGNHCKQFEEKYLEYNR